MLRTEFILSSEYYKNLTVITLLSIAHPYYNET